MTLGEFLRQEREKRAITIEQVASETKISVRILHALESDQYVELPAPPFIRGFVTSYVRFIGLDPKEVLTRFNDFIEERSKSRPSRDGGHSGYAFEKREGDENRTWLWMLLGSFLLIGVVLVIFFKPLKHKHHSHADKLRTAHSASPAPSESASPSASASPSPEASAAAAAASPTPSPSASPAAAATQASPLASPSPSAKPSPKPSPSPSASPDASKDPLNSGASIPISEVKQKVTFKAKDRVWVRYQVDDRPANKLILGKDRVLVLRARNRIVIQAADPALLSMNTGNQGYRPLSQAKNTATHSSGMTLYFQPQDAGNKEDPFAGEGALPALPATPPGSPSPESEPSR